jgi:hypothetical protein
MDRLTYGFVENGQIAERCTAAASNLFGEEL